jgi:hypothetical protein
VDLRKYVRPLPGVQDDGATGRAQPPRRVVSMAVIVAALLLGAAVGRVLPTTAATGATAQSAAPASQATEPFVYFPSQYVNQATEVEEHIQAY